MQARPTREAILPELAEPVPVATYNTRIVAMRTSLGRAAIGLELRGANDVIRGSQCDVLAPERVQIGCIRCELAGEGDPFDSAVLDAIVAAFDRYPTAVLDATRIDKVSICKTLRYEDIASERVIGTVDLRERRLFMSVAPFMNREYDDTGHIRVAEIVHHELFHLFEYQRMREAFDNDSEWGLLNPLGFEYASRADDEPRKTGFINPYAATADHEDRASTYQYLLGRPDELCEVADVDATVRAKTRLLWRRISSLVGPAFLRERAACVLPWLDRVEPGPSHAEVR